jgi:hypothetical protein
MALRVMKTIREQYTAPLHNKGLPADDKITKSNAASKLELWIDANGYTETRKKRSVMAYKAICRIQDSSPPARPRTTRCRPRPSHTGLPR